ncbi:MAG: hypothetical protein HY060_11025 [Proteobacteria bacterium]|nr:hypothetical protein [Pseudomonadota bacterium]
MGAAQPRIGVLVHDDDQALEFRSPVLRVGERGGAADDMPAFCRAFAAALGVT